MDPVRFADLAKSLAWQLGQLRGEDWTAHVQPAATYGTLAGGIARLSLSWDSRAHRLVVCGKGPDGYSLARKWQRRVDPQRGLLVIGREIDRTVISAGYADDLLAANARKAARDASDAERASWLGKVRELFGIGPGDEPGKVYLARFVKGSGYVQSYGHGDGDTGHLDITLSGIPAQVALDMLAVLAKDTEAQVLCCRTYGPAHHPSLALAGCLHRGCDHQDQRGEQGSRIAVYGFLTKSRGLDKAEVVKAMDEARASRYQVSEIYDGERIAAIVSWDTEGCGEFTVEVPREAS